MYSGTKNENILGQFFSLISYLGVLDHSQLFPSIVSYLGVGGGGSRILALGHSALEGRSSMKLYVTDQPLRIYLLGVRRHLSLTTKVSHQRFQVLGYKDLTGFVMKMIPPVMAMI